LKILLIVLALALNGCSMGYLTTSAWRQTKLLAGRTSFDAAQRDERLTQDERALLGEVPAVLEFAKADLKLNVGGAYSKFSFVPKDALSWVVMGARKDRFALKTWWFPIVGTVPYKGFLEEADAREGATALEAEGFETWVRPAGAYSTLGWFNDPVVPSMLQGGRLALTNTLIHELSHRSFWVADHVDFNESAANVIGTFGAAQFFTQRNKVCSTTPTDSGCGPGDGALHEQSCREITQVRELSAALTELHAGLSKIYDHGGASVLAERDLFFAAWRGRYPDLTKNWTVLNNARLMQAKLYYTRLDDLFRLVSRIGIPRFIELVNARDDEVANPWTWLDTSITELNAGGFNERQERDEQVCGLT
jgi:hypothetical protein